METPYWLSRLIYSFFLLEIFSFLDGVFLRRVIFKIYPVLSCFLALCFLSCPILSCTVLPYSVLSCHVLSYSVLYCHVLSYPVLCCTVLCCPLLYCLVLSCTVLSYSAITPWYAGIYHLSHISSSILMSIISSSSSQYWRTLCRLARIQLRGLDLIEYDRK